MNQKTGGLACAIGCLLIAGLGGLLIAVMLWALAGFAVFGALFFGALAALIGWGFLSWAFCRELPGPNEVKVTAASTTPVSTRPAAATAPATSSAPAAFVSETPKPAPAATKKPAAAKPKPKAAPAAKKAAPAKAPAKAAAKAKPVAKDGKPETLSKPRGGKGDDLKQIKGVGPKLEGTLNEMGFWHFDQIAGWRKKEIEWVDERLKFKGRIERDDWISQAKTLAKGGTTEFSKRVKKGNVY